ncbi:hypothetical protein ACWF94_29000 [Streptomyces sp. NPDC055078]
MGIALTASSLVMGAPNATAGALLSLPPVAAGDSRSEVQSLTSQQRLDLQAEIDATIAETSNGAVQISANEISWDGGEVIMALPLPGAAAAPGPTEAALALDGVSAAEMAAVQAEAANWNGCPAGDNDNRWYCFYQLPRFEGRRLQWNHAHCSTGINFADYGFNDKTTGIVNTTRNIDFWGMKLTMFHDWFTGHVLRVPPYTKISELDSFHDNKFSSFRACRI